VSQPVHGQLDCPTDRCLYVPPPGFTGTDRFTYTLGGKTSTATAEVRVQVAPIVQTVAGDWNDDGITDLGWFHGRFLDFFYLQIEDLYTDPRRPEVVYSCDHPPVAAQPGVRLPLAGDWDGDGRSEIGLFDPATREYVLYGEGFVAGEWVVREQFTHPVPGRGGLPVAGNWDGQDGDEVGLFLPEEHRYLLLGAHASDAAVTEVVLTDLTGEGWLPVAGDWGEDGTGADVVGAWNPTLKALRLRTGNSSGPTELHVYTGQDVGPQPFSGRWLQNVSIGFFDPGTGDGGWPAFLLYVCDFDPDCGDLGGRTTILLPPPEDPFGTPCADG